MKYFYISFLFITSNLFAQSTQISNDDLYTLGKIWGLIKYYNPAVSQGKVDWDKVLLETLAHKTELTNDQITTHWFEIVDKTSFDIIDVKQTQFDSITTRNFDVKWINKAENINLATKKKLLQLINHPKNIGTYYSNPIANSIRFSSQNEKVYDYFSTHLKLLELFRIWNAIEYYYPYKYLLDTHWDDVLKKYIPIFKNIRNEKEYRVAISKLTAEIQDTHTSLKNSYQYDIFGKLTSPFTFQVIDTGVLITGIKDEKKTQKAAIKVGDFITKIDGKSIAQIISEKSEFIAVSNESIEIREAYNYLFSSNDSICTIEGIKENGKAFQTNVERMQRIFYSEWDKDGIPNYHLFYKNKEYEYLVWSAKENRLNPLFRLDDKAYVEFSSLVADEVDSLMQTLQNTKGIVFDLRGYTDDGALLKIFDYLFLKPQFFGIKTQPNFLQPGTFCFVDHIITKDNKYVGKENPNAYKGQVIVLINEYTQSAAELWAMIFKKIPNVILVGSQTAGADGNITNIKLTDGNELRFSGLGIYYPDGTETQRIGIIPDIFMRPTINSIRKREDVLLQKAFELIDKSE